MHTTPEPTESDLRDQTETAGADAADSLVDSFLTEIADSDDAGERAGLLVELSELLERDQGDAAGALRCARAALEEDPGQSAAADRLTALLERAGQFSDLADFLTDRIERARSEGAERAPLARRLADLSETRLDDRGRAIAAWQEIRSERPADRDALTALARLLAGAGQLRQRLEVLAALADLTESKSERAALHREMAAGHEDLGEVDRAADHLESALSNQPGAAADYQRLATMYLSLGQIRAAIDAQIRRADLCQGGERAELLLEIAALYEGALSDPGRAIDFCVLAERAAPDHLAALRTLVRLYQARDDFDAAASALERWAGAAHEPTERAELLARAAELCRRELGDLARAGRLLGTALELAPGHTGALAGLARLWHEQGDLQRAASLFDEAQAAAATTEQRAALYLEAAQLRHQRGDAAGAVELYRSALETDPDLHAAAEPLADLLWQEGQLGEVVGLYEELLKAPPADPAVALERHQRLAQAYRTLGLDRRALLATRRALVLAPDHADLLRMEADLCFRTEAWADAAACTEALLAAAPTDMAAGERVILCHRAAVAAARTGHPERARERLSEVLKLDPGHTGALEELLALLGDDPHARVEVLRLLADHRRGRARAAALVELGDVLLDPLDSPIEALFAYREALTLAPDDHILIHKCLDLLAAERRWVECNDLLDQLMDSEDDPVVRAKYAVAAAMVCRDELDDPDDALRLLWGALDDDPSLSEAAEALEGLLRARRSWQALANLYCKLLTHLGIDRDDSEGRRRSTSTDADAEAAGGDPADGDAVHQERVRLWSALAELCWTHLDQKDGALDALEVASRLAPDDSERLRQLAERAESCGAAQRPRAIAAHQRLLAGNKQRTSSYRSLAGLYREAGRDHHAAAADDALAFVAMGADESRPRPATGGLALGQRALTAEMWTALRHPDEDVVQSALFALLAPVVAPAAAVSRKRLESDSGPGARSLPADALASRVLVRVAGALGMPLPEVLACPESRTAIEVQLVADCDGRVAPVVLLGEKLLSGASERVLAFQLGRALASLRGGGILRWVMRPDQLAGLIDAAVSVAGGQSHEIERGLPEAAREQLAALGQRLAARTTLSDAAARSWLTTHDSVDCPGRPGGVWRPGHRARGDRQGFRRRRAAWPGARGPWSSSGRARPSRSWQPAPTWKSGTKAGRRGSRINCRAPAPRCNGQVPAAPVLTGWPPQTGRGSSAAGGPAQRSAISFSKSSIRIISFATVG